MYVNDNVINIYDKEINTFKKGTDQVSVVLRNKKKKKKKKKKTLGSLCPPCYMRDKKIIIYF